MSSNLSWLFGPLFVFVSVDSLVLSLSLSLSIVDYFSTSKSNGQRWGKNVCPLWVHVHHQLVDTTITTIHAQTLHLCVSMYKWIRLFAYALYIIGFVDLSKSPSLPVYHHIALWFPFMVWLSFEKDQNGRIWVFVSRDFVFPLKSRHRAAHKQFKQFEYRR